MNDWRRERRRLGWERLCGDEHSPGTSDCGTGRSSMGQSGSPVMPIEDKEETVLGRLRDNVDVSSVVTHGQELRANSEDRSPTDRDGWSGSATGAFLSSRRARPGCSRRDCCPFGCRRRSRNRAVPNGMKTMPFSASTVISLQLWTPPARRQDTRPANCRRRILPDEGCCGRSTCVRRSARRRRECLPASCPGA